jgi:hypothetical protein
MARARGVWLNGQGGDVPDEQFDPFQLYKGILVELEHTSDKRIAKIIAKQHLFMEHPFYYDFLEDAENKMKEDIKINRMAWL